jgi:hypothetical protein
MEPKIILDLCGGTGSWSAPYREAGYDVRIVDPFSDHPDATREDVRLYVPPENVHGVLAAPPCTDLAGSGARWWAAKGPGALLEALSIADACLRIIIRSRPEWWALENPVGRLRTYYGDPRLIFHPWEFGHPTLKRTLLWGDFTVPERTPVEPTDGQVVWRMGPSPDRAKKRSMTPLPFARAFLKANP